MPVIGRTPYRNLILTGTTGVGKTGVGRMIAAKMDGAKFIDAEVEIQQREGQSIEQIRETFGMARLRSLEKELVNQLTLHRSTIIAVKATTLTDPANLESLAETGPVLCLTAAWGEILRRLHVAYGGRFHQPNYRSSLIGLLKRESGVLSLPIPQLDTTHLSIEAVTEQSINFWRAQSDL